MSTDLRTKFQALRTFVEGIPAEKLDMRDPFIGKDGCGCVIAHARAAKLRKYDGICAIKDHIEINTLDIHHLFNGGIRDYPIYEGQPAKDEFLRRLDALELKYCGAVS